MKLYVKRVFITDEAEILPRYLRFVRGLADSADLPLNVSREMIQESPILTAIKRGVTNRVLSELEKTAQTDSVNFTGIWDSFGRTDPRDQPAARDRLTNDQQELRDDAAYLLLDEARSRPGAPISTPLACDELSSVRPNHFTVENLPTRLRHLDADPWADLITVRQVLPPSSRARGQRR